MTGRVGAGGILQVDCGAGRWLDEAMTVDTGPRLGQRSGEAVDRSQATLQIESLENLEMPAVGDLAGWRGWVSDYLCFEHLRSLYNGEIGISKSF